MAWGEGGVGRQELMGAGECGRVPLPPEKEVDRKGAKIPKDPEAAPLCANRQQHTLTNYHHQSASTHHNESVVRSLTSGSNPTQYCKRKSEGSKGNYTPHADDCGGAETMPLTA